MRVDLSDGAVVVEAPAKLTLSLHITGVRSDGYHLIDAEMVSLSLCDVLTIDPAGDRLSVRGPLADGVPTDGGNLVAKALHLVRRTANVTIDKRIPHGAGLGGGSTDAAAVLRWAGVADAALAATIGADVGFCVIGGRARVSGVGDVVEALEFEHRQVTVVIPPLRVSTPAAYAMWDLLGGPQGDAVNHLEPAAIAVVPELARWRDRIGEASGEVPVLAGSGSAWFVAGDHRQVLSRLVGDGARVVAARTVPPERGAVRRLAP